MKAQSIFLLGCDLVIIITLFLTLNNLAKSSGKRGFRAWVNKKRGIKTEGDKLFEMLEESISEARLKGGWSKGFLTYEHISGIELTDTSWPYLIQPLRIPGVIGSSPSPGDKYFLTKNQSRRLRELFHETGVK